MDERTRAYLRGRFRDYYRGAELPLPPAADRREWGYIPWAPGGTTMVRHRALYELGGLPDFLSRQRPRHVYFSAGRYRDPGAGSMGEKGWEGSDLVFDIDADHLPDVRPEEDGYAEMLDAAKGALRRLLDLLREDFDFSDVTVVFSGGRGYHVHVRDERVRGLDREARREVVDYVRGIGVEFDGLVTTTRSGTATRRVLRTDGGWGRRVHGRLLSFLDDVAAMDDDEALSELRSFDRIGEKRAESILRVARERREEVARGTVELGGPAIRTLAEVLTDRTVEAESAAIDEPVTTDIHRLIRLPNSLHGGTALRVTPIDPDDLADFDPLRDAVPEVFADEAVRMRFDGDPPEDLLADLGETFRTEGDVTVVPERAALFLMARGRGEKAP